jgi:hypothetical protein
MNIVSFDKLVSVILCSFQPGHADSYINLKVTFVNGRNPNLYLKKGGQVVETIDLAPVR